MALDTTAEACGQPKPRPPHCQEQTTLDVNQCHAHIQKHAGLMAAKGRAMRAGYLEVPCRATVSLEQA